MGQKLAVLLFSLLLAAWLPVQAYAEEVKSEQAETVADVSVEDSPAALSLDAAGRIEQIYVNMPDFYVYGTGFGRDDASEGRAFVNQTELALDTAYPESSGEEDSGTAWYVLLDISGSMPDSYFRTVKEGIKNLQESLDDGDSLVLCTFGNEVRLLADGSQSTEEMSQVLEELDNSDQQTLLFEAIDKAAGLSTAGRDDERRRSIIAVITDGEDIAKGKVQAEEALDTLTECGTPVYAFCINDTKRDNINSFSEFARTSGGTSRVFKASEGSDILTDLKEETEGYTVLHYRSASNLVSNAEEVFSLHLSDGTVIRREVMMNRWQEDTEAPRLVSASAISPSQLELVFSEALLGADNAANYKLTYEGTGIGISSVTYLDGEEPAAELMLQSSVGIGSYSLLLSGITDVSMEKNPVESSSGDSAGTGQAVVQFVLDEVPQSETASLAGEGTDQSDSTAEVTKQEEARFGRKAEKDEETPGLMLLLVAVLIAAAVLIAVIAVIVASKKRKATKKSSGESEIRPHIPDSPPAGQAYAYEKHGMVPKQVKQHLAADIPVTLIQAEVSLEGMKTINMTWQLETSLIVGRSSICDICIDNRQLSRQHFCLEAEGDSILISDLGSTNGTSVNGIRINNRRRLEPGSLIEVGTMKIRLNW